MPLSSIGSFVRHEAFGGILLMAAAVLALVLVNSPLAPLYDSLLKTQMTVAVGAFSIDKPVLLWINDGLMAVFFFLIGLEIKRGFVEGELSSPSKATLPALAAVGGMLVPAAIYAIVNWGDPVTSKGWAIPAATDIAFALGVLALLGRRAPLALKVFLLAVAVLDDLGAIVIIALFYTADLSTVSLATGLGGLAVLLAFNRLGIVRIAPYLLVGIVIWVFVLKSGVHATLAGVLIALMIPLRDRKSPDHSPLKSLEHALHPSVAFGILPVFAFANAGVSLSGLSLESLLHPVPLGIALGLFVGKQIGVFGFTWIAVKTGLGRLPEGVGWPQVYAVALLTGIGFTMSLFIGTLAFADETYSAGIRIGVLGGSILSAIAGYTLLRLATRRVHATAAAPPHSN